MEGWGFSCSVGEESGKNLVLDVLGWTSIRKTIS